MSPTIQATEADRPVDASAGPGEPGVKPMRKDALRNRELLIDSARVVFAQRGMDACLDDIAHHAGLGVGTAYRHFANKHELLSALMDQLVEQFITAAEASLDIADPWAALVSFLEQAVDMQVNDRGLREVMLGYHDPTKFVQAHDRVGAVITTLLERARTAGRVRADAETSDIGIIIAMLCTSADFASTGAPQLWRRYLAVCLEGLRPSANVLPEQPLTQDELRATVAAHKQATTRPC